ncbi:MAG TPA: DUF3857 domain-containing protein, partial [Terriglobia bacterium]|nr:DUF3857 domain-containing protein [Terriglobia bacterium]
MLRTGLVVLLFCGSFTFAQTGQPALPDAPSTATKPGAKPDYSQEPYVIESMRTKYRFENDGTGSRQTDIRVKVQNEAGLEQLGQIVIGYSSASERVDVNYVRVIKADGSKVTAGPEAIQDLSSPVAQVAPVYTDFRQKHITVPGLRPGETLEYSYTTVFQTPLAAGQFWAEYDFNNTSIVLDEQLDINIPRARTVKLKVKPAYPPKITDEGDRRDYHWASSHLVAETSEERKKRRQKRNSDEEERPAVQMSTFSTWEEVGRWYESLEKDRRAVTPELKAKAEELTRDKTTQIDKLKALYDYVAKNFRYVSLSFGVGRYQPHAAAEVFTNQYGDCKDKHTLLEALAEAIGLHPWSVLINSSRKLDPDIPSPSQFDHVITLVPVGSDMVWLDTTTEVAPFRMLSFNIRDKQALAIPPDGTGRLMSTPADLPFQGTQKIDVSGKITDLGRLEATVNYTMRGDAELLLRMLFRRVPAARWNDLVKVLAQADGFNPESASNLKADAPEDTDHAFHLSYTVSQPNYFDWSSKKARLDLPVPHMRLIVPDDDDDSTDPLKLGPISLIDETLKLELPSKYTADAPLPVALEKDFGRYQATYKLDGHVLTAERILKTNVTELPAARIPEFLSFRRTLASDEGQQVGLESATAGSGKEFQGMKADDLHQAGIDALRSNNFKLAAELFEQVVQLEPKHKFAWNNLGRAYMGLGEYDKAVVATRKQIEINPYDEFAYNNLGRVLWLQRKYDDAAAAFRKQIELNPLDKFAHNNLGSLLVDQKKYAEAV